MSWVLLLIRIGVVVVRIRGGGIVQHREIQALGLGGRDECYQNMCFFLSRAATRTGRSQGGAMKSLCRLEHGWIEHWVKSQLQGWLLNRLRSERT